MVEEDEARFLVSRKIRGEVRSEVTRGPNEDDVVDFEKTDS